MSVCQSLTVSWENGWMNFSSSLKEVVKIVCQIQDMSHKRNALWQVLVKRWHLKETATLARKITNVNVTPSVLWFHGERKQIIVSDMNHKQKVITANAANCRHWLAFMLLFPWSMSNTKLYGEYKMLFI